MFKRKLKKQPEPTEILGYDLKLTQIGNIWLWDLYLDGKRTFWGRTDKGIRSAFRDARARIHPHKIITASVNKEKK